MVKEGIHYGDPTTLPSPFGFFLRFPPSPEYALCPFSLASKRSSFIRASLEYAVEKTERASERISNEKIMAINEYSETVLATISGIRIVSLLFGIKTLLFHQGFIGMDDLFCL